MSDTGMPAVAMTPRTGVFVLAAASLVYALLAQTVFPFGADEALYIGAAKSMVSGAGYRAAGRALTLYPPGWPLLLTPVAALSGGDYGWFARYTAALIPLILYVSWVLYSGRKERFRWWLVVALAASVPLFDVGTREVRSEIAFTVLTVGFLAWAERMAESRSAGWADSRILGGTLLLLGSMATRTIGVALLGAIVATGLHLAMTDRTRLRRYAQRMTVPATVCLLYLLAWGRWSAAQMVESYPGEPTVYARWFWIRDARHPAAGTASLFEVLARIPDNVRIQASGAASMLTNFGWIAPSWTSPLVVVSTVVLVAGLLEESRRPVPLLFWYVLGYMGVLCVWPFDEGARYLIPLLPLLGLLAVSGCRALARAIALRPTRIVRLVSLVAALELAAIARAALQESAGLGKQTLVALFIWSACLVVGFLRAFRLPVPGASEPRRIMNYSRAAYMAGYLVLGVVGIAKLTKFNVTGQLQLPGQPIRRVSDWIAANAPESSVVMARQYGSLTLATHRRTVPFPLTSSIEVMGAAVRRQKPRFLVVVDSTAYEYYFPTEPERLTVINKALGTPLRQRVRLEGATVYEFPQGEPVAP